MNDTAITPKLTSGGEKKLHKHFKAIEDGIAIVSRLHMADNSRQRSLGKTGFENAYIERLFSPIIAAISASTKGLMKLIADQQAQATGINAEPLTLEKRKEIIKKMEVKENA